MASMAWMFWQMWDGSTAAQNQLAMAGGSCRVPDGSATVFLMGCSFVGIFAFKSREICALVLLFYLHFNLIPGCVNLGGQSVGLSLQNGVDQIDCLVGLLVFFSVGYLVRIKLKHDAMDADAFGRSLRRFLFDFHLDFVRGIEELRTKSKGLPLQQGVDLADRLSCLLFGTPVGDLIRVELQHETMNADYFHCILCLASDWKRRVSFNKQKPLRRKDAERFRRCDFGLRDHLFQVAAHLP